MSARLLLNDRLYALITEQLEIEGGSSERQYRPGVIAKMCTHTLLGIRRPGCPSRLEIADDAIGDLRRSVDRQTKPAARVPASRNPWRIHARSPLVADFVALMTCTRRVGWETGYGKPRRVSSATARLMSYPTFFYLSRVQWRPIKTTGRPLVEAVFLTLVQEEHARHSRGHRLESQASIRDIRTSRNTRPLIIDRHTKT